MIVLLIWLTSCHLFMTGPSWWRHPPTPDPGFHEGKNTQEHRRQPDDGWTRPGCQLQGLRRRHGGNLWLPQLSETGDRADEAPTGHTDEPRSYLQGPAALSSRFPRWLVSHPSSVTACGCRKSSDCWENRILQNLYQDFRVIEIITICSTSMVLQLWYCNRYSIMAVQVVLVDKNIHCFMHCI